MAWRSQLFAALRHPAEPCVLLLRSGGRWRPPRAFVRRGVWVANAEVAVPALEQRLGTKPWLLRQLWFAEDEQRERIETVYELALLDEEWKPPAHGRWVGRDDLDGLHDEAQRKVLDAYLDARERDETPPERPPWARSGWVDDVRAWLEDETARLGLALLGIEQVKQWSISSVLRVETDGPDLYFKVSAPLPLFVEEATVTARLAERFPAHVPRPLALEPGRGWMLFNEFDLAGWDAPLELRCEVFRRFAGLQLQTAGLTDELLADGCLDRRLDVLERQLDPLLDDRAGLHKLGDEEVRELRQLTPKLKELCGRLAGLGLPATLVHGDLHVGNVARRDGNLTYFDWTDACIAHPFIDLHSLQWERDEARRAAQLDAYLEPWREAASEDVLREAVALAAAVTPLHHAVSYQTIVAGLEPASKPELDAAHTFLREALARAREL
jgi:Phosphotransferase enzyme family